jgi:fatty-acyl-CoA synthase
MKAPMTPVEELAPEPARRIASPAKDWLRALERTAPIAANPGRIFPAVIEDLAGKLAHAPALLSSGERFTYAALAERSNRYARWALEQGIAKGDVVCLLMPNRPEYMAIWLGITRVGGVVALLNTRLPGPSLAHCMNIVNPSHLIVDARHVDSVIAALPRHTGAPKLWVHGAGRDEFPRIDDRIERYSGESVSCVACPPVTTDDRALYIYSSGTTGMPKAAGLSHARLMQWTHWFAGMLEILPSDRMYNCLPMYHSVGGVLATGAVLAAGGSVVIRESFSASRFWADVVRWDCTLFQYIGELCRYLLHAKPHPLENSHGIRLCCGNGLRPDIWRPFQMRFQIPRIFEFYAATEGTVSLFNVEGKPGAIGRIPQYLAHRFPAALVRLDAETDQPVRNQEGLCVLCGPHETGEAIGPLDDRSNIANRFEGYASEDAGRHKILRNVFAPGDAWYRTGDLMRKDEQGYFYFVDRIGDTFRWKGENVATSEVAEVICAFPAITHAIVYGVTVPGAEGRAGMALLVAPEDLNLAAFRTHLIGCLPDYARPLFLRLRSVTEITGTFKYAKNVFARDGYDPAATADVIYFDHPEQSGFVRLDPQLYDRIQLGQVRL